MPLIACISASHFKLKLDLARESVCFMLVFWERDRESGSRFLFRISIHGTLEGLDYSDAPLIVDSPL